MALLASSIVFVMSLAAVLMVFCINLLVVWLVYLVRGEKTVKARPIEPLITVVVVVRNAASIIEEKIKNTLSLDYPADRLELIISSDGSTDRTEDIVQPYIGGRVRLVSSPLHEGKNSALNRAVAISAGEILVFTDADALLEKGALRRIVPHFADEDVGGVCGQRVIAEHEMRLEKAQSDYIRFDSSIKRLESKTGSITSNDGKLYAIRK
ncbi:MAG: glycosyltransferase, partial [Deltaproteobacteria bacterium]|nr:glycosyltransferase [Deltaproteobacteria bacterium]